jgi:hypothetical protein
MADVLKFIASGRENLAALLKEVRKMSGRYGEGLLQEVFKGSGKPADGTSEVMDVGIFGQPAIAERLMTSDSWDQFCIGLVQEGVIKHFVEHNPDELCKILTENSALADKVSQTYLFSQLASGQLSHKEHFEKLFAADCKNTLLNAMQSFLMLKSSTEEILHLLPVQSIVEYTLSRLVSDTSFDVPVSHYQKFMEAIAMRVSHTEFAALFYNAVMVSSNKNKFCP